MRSAAAFEREGWGRMSGPATASRAGRPSPACATPRFRGQAPSSDRLPPSSFADDEPRDLDVICRIKTPIQAVPDLVNKFAFSWTALAFNDDGVGTFEGVSDKNVDNLPHGKLHL